MEYNYVSPDHYKNIWSKEVYEMMIDIWGEKLFIAFCEMNAFKYRMRLGLKPDQDVETELLKAMKYMELKQEVLDGSKKEKDNKHEEL